MLRSVTEILGYVLSANNGEIGKCSDLLFDDDSWRVRFMVADTARWLPGRKVLVSPIHLDAPEWSTRRFPVSLSRQQIEGCPPLDEHAPVSRRQEAAFFEYYGLNKYWTDQREEAQRLSEEAVAEAGVREEIHLRSMAEVRGYHIRAKDGEIGHVDDFIVTDDSWRVAFLVIDTRNWLPGKKVLISPTWVDSVNWASHLVRVGLTKKAVKESPEYDPNQPVNRDYETRLYDYYGRPLPPTN